MSEQNGCMIFPVLDALRSLAEPTNFVPLSDQMTEGVPQDQLGILIPLHRNLHPLTE